LQKQNKFIDVFALVHQNNNYHIPAVVSYLKFIILDYLGVKKSGIFNWSRDFCCWFI